MRILGEEIDWKEERFRLLSDKVDKNIMADAEMEAELQGLQAGEERRLAIHRKRLIAVWRRKWSRFPRWKRIRKGLSFMLCVKYSSENSTPPHLPRKDEQEQGRASQQVALPTPGGINEGLLCEEEKEKRNSQGKDPRTSERKQPEEGHKNLEGRCHKEEKWQNQEKKRKEGGRREGRKE